MHTTPLHTADYIIHHIPRMHTTPMLVLALAALFACADAGHPLFGARAPPGTTLSACNGGLCGGQAHYPIHGGANASSQFGVVFNSSFNVPGLPLDPNGTTFFVYFNIFFPDKGNGRMNQFVPQLMLGRPLAASTGPPDYDPVWQYHKTWVFAAQYFFEIYNETTGKIDGHAAAGPLHNASEGEIIYTSFTLDQETWAWTMAMGVVGDATRVSRLVVPAPYMALLPATQTTSWSEDTYRAAYVNSCWELYGISAADQYPSSGSTFDMRTTVSRPNAIVWDTHWSDRGGATCPGHPTSTFEEHHNATVQDVVWDINFDEAEKAAPRVEVRQFVMAPVNFLQNHCSV